MGLCLQTVSETLVLDIFNMQVFSACFMNTYAYHKYEKYLTRWTGGAIIKSS